MTIEGFESLPGLRAAGGNFFIPRQARGGNFTPDHGLGPQTFIPRRSEG